MRHAVSNGGAGSRTLTEGAKQTLLQWIRDGKYPPGSQLPSVPDLVERLSVSRTVVREALRDLAGMNLVEIQPGRGCFVRSVPAGSVFQVEGVAPLLDLDALIEVAEARRAIEAGVARVAAVTATLEDFDELEAVLFRIERVAARNQPMHSVTPGFHVAIARATHNRVLENVVSSFNALMASAGKVIESELVGQEYRRGECDSHRRLLDVLRTRDPDLAQREMEAHIAKTVDVLRAIRQRGRGQA